MDVRMPAWGWGACAAAVAGVAVALGSGCPSGGCDAMEGPARDRCYHDEILSTPAAEVERVQETAARIQDPVFRSAAVFEWVNAHAREAGVQASTALCQTLDEPARGTCLRRLSSAHLQR